MVYHNNFYVKTHSLTLPSGLQFPSQDVQLVRALWLFPTSLTNSVILKTEALKVFLFYSFSFFKKNVAYNI